MQRVAPGECWQFAGSNFTGALQGNKSAGRTGCRYCWLGFLVPITTDDAARGRRETNNKNSRAAAPNRIECTTCLFSVCLVFLFYVFKYNIIYKYMYVCNFVQGTLYIQVYVANYAFFPICRYIYSVCLLRLYVSILLCVFSSIFCAFVMATVAPTRCQRS